MLSTGESLKNYTLMIDLTRIFGKSPSDQYRGIHLGEVEGTMVACSSGHLTAQFGHIRPLVQWAHAMVSLEFRDDLEAIGGLYAFGRGEQLTLF